MGRVSAGRKRSTRSPCGRARRERADDHRQRRGGEHDDDRHEAGAADGVARVAPAAGEEPRPHRHRGDDRGDAARRRAASPEEGRDEQRQEPGEAGERPDADAEETAIGDERQRPGADEHDDDEDAPGEDLRTLREGPAEPPRQRPTTSRVNIVDSARTCVSTDAMTAAKTPAARTLPSSPGAWPRSMRISTGLAAGPWRPGMSIAAMTPSSTLGSQIAATQSG